MRAFLVVVLPALLLACEQNTCPDELPECPVGTTLTIVSHSKSVFQADVEVDPPTAHGDGNAETWGECSYSCVAQTACPEGTVEYYTDDCFECAPLDDEGIAAVPAICVAEPEARF